MISSLIFAVFIIATIGAVIYWLKKSNHQPQRHRRHHREPVIRFDDQQLEVEPEVIDMPTPAEAARASSATLADLGYEDEIKAAQRTLAESKPEPQPEPAETKKMNHNDVIYIFLSAAQDKPYVGYELLQSLLACGMRYGEMNMFHRYDNPAGAGRILFSLAQANDPGTFELAKMGAVSTPGLVMFVRLHSTPDALQAFNAMMDVAKTLTTDLGGAILNDQQQPMTADTIKQLREKIKHYEQHRHTADLFEYEGQ